MTEIFKVKTGIAQEFVKGVLEFTDVPYNLRNLSKCNSSRMASKRHLQNHGPKLWGKVPTGMKSSKYLEEFKVRIESWVPKKCLCKICKLFIKHVGYL